MSADLIGLCKGEGEEGWDGDGGILKVMLNSWGNKYNVQCLGKNVKRLLGLLSI